MDITISPYNLKRFAASITCLGKIGKDLYLSFDPLDGLTLSSLNEAKSAFSKFHFEPGFFEKCGGGAAAADGAPGDIDGGRGGGPRRNCRAANKSAPRDNHSSSDNSNSTNHRTNDDNNYDNDKDGEDDNVVEDDARYVCRVPVRSVHSILRPRKGVISLRIRSEGMDGDGHFFGLNRKKQGKGDDGGGSGKGRDRHGHHRCGGGSRSRSRDAVEDEDEDEDNLNGRRQECRRRGEAPSSAFTSRERSRSRRRRKQNNSNDDNDNDDDVNGISHNTEKMMLSFEYYIECLTSNKDMNSNHHHNHHKSFNSTSRDVGGGTFRVVHKVGVTDCNAISVSESIAQRRTRSEIISHPRLWLRLIDPLRRTPEMALTIDDKLKVVTATSFHPMEVQSGGNNNAILQAAVARNAVLKTETSMGADEFDEFDFRTNRGKKRKKRKDTSRNEGTADSDDNESGDIAGEEETNDDKEGEERDRPPLDVNQKVILVFSIKEAKVRNRCSHFLRIFQRQITSSRHQTQHLNIVV